MGNDYEVWDNNRADLIYEKDRILAPLQPGMLAAPHPMAEGKSDADYYRGEVHGPTMAQIDWVKERRPEDPSLEQAKAAPAAVEEATK